MALAASRSPGEEPTPPFAVQEAAQQLYFPSPRMLHSIRLQRETTATTVTTATSATLNSERSTRSLTGEALPAVEVVVPDPGEPC